MKKLLKFVSLFLGIGLSGSLFSCGENPIPSGPVQDNFSISCERTDYYYGENDSITIRIADGYVLNNHRIGDATMRLDTNTCGATITKSGDNWLFKATRLGSATVSGKIGDLISSNTLTFSVIYSENKIKENFQAALDTEGGVVFGQTYDLGLSNARGDTYTVTGADGILEINNDGKLEVKGIGQGKVKLLKDEVEQIECRYTVFNSTLVTKIKRDLISQGKIESLSSLVPNSLLTNITSLDLSGELINDQTASFGVKYLTELKTLNLSSNNLSDASFISSLSNLETLDLSDNVFTDISSIVDNENLKYLDLKNNKLKSITNLQYLYKIEYLDLSNNLITNISPLSSSYSLKSLFLNNNKVQNFRDSLSALEDLKVLGLGNCGISFTDIISLRYLPNIEYLDISGTKPTVKTIGTTLTKLKTLILEDCDLGNLSVDDSLSYFNQLTELETLNIAFNGLDLEKWVGNNGLPLIDGASLTKLSSLAIGGNEFNVFPGLSSFAALKTLDVTESYNLSDISSLVSLNIETLILDNCNSISNNDVAELILSNTNIKNLSTIGAFNYLDSENYNQLVAAVSSGNLSWRFMNEVWTTSETIYNYSRIIYFSMSDLLARGVVALSVENKSYEFKAENGQEIIISFVSDMGNLAGTHYTFNVPKEIYRIQIYGNQYYTYDMSFQIEERKESSVTFNLYNFKDNVSAKNGDVISALAGSRVFVNSLAGENILKGGDGYVARGDGDIAVITAAGSAIDGYDAFIKSYNNTSLSLIGGNGGKGPNCFESPLYDGHTPWAGVDAGDGADAIKCHNCDLFGKNITITGGNGGNGGNSNSGMFNPQHTGSGGNGGNGICYSGTISNESSATISGGVGGNKGTGGNVANNPHDGSNGSALKKVN